MEKFIGGECWQKLKDNYLLIKIKEKQNTMMIGNAAFAYVCDRIARLFVLLGGNFTLLVFVVCYACLNCRCCVCCLLFCQLTFMSLFLQQFSSIWNWYIRYFWNSCTVFNILDRVMTGLRSVGSAICFLRAGCIKRWSISCTFRPIPYYLLQPHSLHFPVHGFT